jgi:hypothetical protein
MLPAMKEWHFAAMANGGDRQEQQEEQSVVVSHVQKPRSSRVSAGWGTVPASLTVRKRAGTAPMVFAAPIATRRCLWNGASPRLLCLAVFNKLMDGLGVTARTRQVGPKQSTSWTCTFSAGKTGNMLNKDGGRLPPPVRDDLTIQLLTIYHGLRLGAAFATG